MADNPTEGQQEQTPEQAQTVEQLEAKRTELRAGAIAALEANDDAKADTLRNEMKKLGNQILDMQATAQADDRTTYMGVMHDGLQAFEVEGFVLDVKQTIDKDGKPDRHIVYTPTQAVIDSIIEVMQANEATRPSTATNWHYGRDADDPTQFAFDFGKASRKPASNGDKVSGWVKDGNTVELKDAFEACASQAEKAEDAQLKGQGSKQYAGRAKVVRKAGYKKA